MGFRSRLKKKVSGFLQKEHKVKQAAAEKAKDFHAKAAAKLRAAGDETKAAAADAAAKAAGDAAKAAAATKNTKNYVHKFEHTAKTAGKELVDKVDEAGKVVKDVVTTGEAVVKTGEEVARTAHHVKNLAHNVAKDATKTVAKAASEAHKVAEVPKKIATAVKSKTESEVNTAAAGLSKASNTIVRTVKDVRQTLRKDSSNVKEHVEHLTAPVKALAKHVGDAVEKGEAEVSGAKEETKNLIENGADKLDVVSHAIAKNVMRDINNVKQDANSLKNGALNAIARGANDVGGVIVGEVEKAEHTVHTLGKGVKILAHDGEHMLVEKAERVGAGIKKVVTKVKTDTATVIHATHLDTVAKDLTKLVSHMAASAPGKSLAAHAKKAAEDAKSVADAAEAAAATAAGAAKEEAEKVAAAAKKAAETAAADAADALKRLTEDTEAHITHMARAADKIVHRIADIPKEIIEKVRHHEREHKAAVETKKTTDIPDVIKGHTEDIKRIHKAAMDGYNKMVKHFDGIEIPDTQQLSDETFGYPAQDLTDLVYVLANDYPGVSLGSASRFSMF